MLERTLADFQASDNEVRSHASLKGHTPLTFADGHMVARAELNNVRWVSTAGTWSSSQWRPDHEFETDRRQEAAEGGGDPTAHLDASSPEHGLRPVGSRGTHHSARAASGAGTPGPAADPNDRAQRDVDGGL